MDTDTVMAYSVEPNAVFVMNPELFSKKPKIKRQQEWKKMVATLHTTTNIQLV